MDSSAEHVQVWAKVNAHVDQDIAPLIEALNAFSGLETTESCQGHSEEPAVIHFLYGEYWKRPWQDLAEFVLGFLGPGLAREIGDDAAAMITMNSAGIACGELRIRQGAFERTLQALTKLRQAFDQPRP